jgi:ABC-type transporter Mla maintaining outer membrane lipid asymmetry ATPase subunit MlaF
MTAPLLSLVDVGFRFGEGLAFEGVSLDVSPAESVGVVVPTGRTSLLMVAAGLRPADRGQVLLDGRPIDSAYRDLAHEATTGFVFQGGGLLENTTIADNIALPLRYHTKMTEVAIEERVRTALEEVGLAAEGGRLPFQIPGGKQRLASLARALAVEPALVFVDDLHLGSTTEIWERFVLAMNRARERWGTSFLSGLAFANGCPPGVDRVVRASPVPA